MEHKTKNIFPEHLPSFEQVFQLVAVTYANSVAAAVGVNSSLAKLANSKLPLLKIIVCASK